MTQRNRIQNPLKPAAVALLCLVLLLPPLTTHAEEEAYEPKVYSNAAVEQEFDDSRILVVLDKRISKVNKKLSKNFFGFLKDAKITDLTQIEGNMAEKNIDEENFRQILEIELPENSKQNVLKVIKQLEKIPGIKYAGPDYVLPQSLPSLMPPLCVPLCQTKIFPMKTPLGRYGKLTLIRHGKLQKEALTLKSVLLTAEFLHTRN